MSKLPLTRPESHFMETFFLCECRNSNLFSNYRVIFSELGLAFFSRFVNTTFYVFSKRCHGKLFPFGENVLFLTFSSFERIFFRTTCWAILARFWNLHFRCPDEYVEDQILLQKKMFFVHFLGNKTLHSSRKLLAVWAKRKRRLICLQDHFEDKKFMWKIHISLPVLWFWAENVKIFVWSFSSWLSQLFSKCP